MKNNQLPNGGGQREEPALGAGEPRSPLGHPGFPSRFPRRAPGAAFARVPGHPRAGRRRFSPRSFYLPSPNTIPKVSPPQGIPPGWFLRAPGGRVFGAAGPGARWRVQRSPARPGVPCGVCCPPGDTGGFAPAHRRRTGPGAPVVREERGTGRGRRRDREKGGEAKNENGTDG